MQIKLFKNKYKNKSKNQIEKDCNKISMISDIFECIIDTICDIAFLKIFFDD